MHKKLEAELVSLAHSILKMENKDDVQVLHKKAQEIYEKLSVLKFVDEFLDVKPTAVETKKEVVLEEEVEITEKVVKKETEITIELEETNNDEIVFEPGQNEVISEEVIEEIFETKQVFVKDDEKDLPSLQISLEEEFKDAISADIATNLFEKVTKEVPMVENVSTEEIKKRSLNDALFNKNIQVGLNDRIAFVKYLFDGSQEDFNRVLSQLNSFTELQEAISFLNDFVKPDYNWQNKEEYENRLMDLIERKFS
jgi:hypothetical protein